MLPRVCPSPVPAALEARCNPACLRPSPCRDLKGNELTGRLPARWARLAALERLALDANALTGPLPPAWNTLEGLQYL